MRGLIVFSESSGVAFYSVDGEFQLFLQHRLRELGAIPEEEVSQSRKLIDDAFSMDNQYVYISCIYFLIRVPYQTTFSR